MVRTFIGGTIGELIALVLLITQQKAAQPLQGELMGSVVTAGLVAAGAIFGNLWDAIHRGRLL